MVVTLWEIHPLRTISILLAIAPALENINTYYFHAKSRIKHNGGNTIAMSQKGKHAHNRPLTPSNSRLKPNLGAISAYAGKKSNQTTKLPGMAMTVYFVQMFVMSAAFPRTVTNAAV